MPGAGAVGASEADPFDDPLRAAMIEIAALAYVPQVQARVDDHANLMFQEWDCVHGEAIEALSDLRRDRYRDIKAQAPDPQVDRMMKPRVRVEDFQEVDPNGQPTMAPLVVKHLMSDEQGHFPISRFNEWERKVIAAELARPTTLAWYRNPPPRSAGDSLCIAYRNEFGNWRGM